MSNLTNQSHQRKRRAAEKSPAPPPLSRRPVPLTADQRAHRLAGLRAALAGSAPEFEARAREGRQP
jgi:hypothetical protein